MEVLVGAVIADVLSNALNALAGRGTENCEDKSTEARLPRSPAGGRLYCSRRRHRFLRERGRT